MDNCSYAKILRECADIADERQEQYGDVTQNFEDVRDICRAMFGIELTVQEVAKIMIAIKWSREKHQSKHDNLIDAVNYTAILAHLSGD